MICDMLYFKAFFREIFNCQPFLKKLLFSSQLSFFGGHIVFFSHWLSELKLKQGNLLSPSERASRQQQQAERNEPTRRRKRNLQGRKKTPQMGTRNKDRERERERERETGRVEEKM